MEYWVRSALLIQMSRDTLQNAFSLSFSFSLFFWAWLIDHNLFSNKTTNRTKVQIMNKIVQEYKSS